jgi:hypothetical protein
MDQSSQSVWRDGRLIMYPIDFFIVMRGCITTGLLSKAQPRT